MSLSNNSPAARGSDFDAIAYAQSFADDILIIHGLTGWSIAWDRAKRRAGACVYSSRTLTFSRILIPMFPPDVIRDVVLHEAAHAVAGPAAKHGPRWKRVAEGMGANPRALLPSWLPVPEGRWVGTCPACGHTRHLHSTPRRVVSCGVCSKTFRRDLILDWTLDGTPVTPSGQYQRELGRLKARFA